jgi:hypothetical protein
VCALVDPGAADYRGLESGLEVPGLPDPDMESLPSASLTALTKVKQSHLRGGWKARVTENFSTRLLVSAESNSALLKYEHVAGAELVSLVDVEEDLLRLVVELDQLELGRGRRLLRRLRDEREREHRSQRGGNGRA